MIWRLDSAGWPRLPLLAVGLLLLFQLALGVANIIYAVPIPLAMAHHGGAVLLLFSLVWLSQKDLVADKESTYVCAQSC
jgi:cytochrome c oxidase assembly protein subunit 15